MQKHVYSFGGGAADGDGKMKDVLGGKGAGLAEMCRAGLPVPPGFTISTEVCNLYFEAGNRVPKEVETQMGDALAKLESEMGRKLGDNTDPLLVSVRSGAKFSMPGMMDTILNLGLNDKSVVALEKKSGNPRFAQDCYRRFIQMFGAVVLDLEKHDFDAIFDGRKKKVKAKLDTDLTAEDLKEVIADYKKLVQKKSGKPFQQDPRQQLMMARDAVFRSWHNPRAIYYRKMNAIPDSLGTAVNKVREALGDSAEHPHYIETLSKRGYRFIFPVEVVKNPSTGPAFQIVEGGSAVETRPPSEPEVLFQPADGANVISTPQTSTQPMRGILRSAAPFLLRRNESRIRGFSETSDPRRNVAVAGGSSP